MNFSVVLYLSFKASLKSTLLFPQLFLSKAKSSSINKTIPTGMGKHSRQPESI